MDPFSGLLVRLRWKVFAVSILAALVFGLAGSVVESQTKFPAAMPEFGNQSARSWINSPPIRQASLRGQVVLLDVYASQ